MAKQPVDPQKAKEQRQKKIAAVGGVILVLVLAIQVPRVMKQMNHSTAPPPVPSTTVAGPATTPGVTTPTATASTDGGLISETNPTAALGQLTSFSSFASKDPFAQIPGSDDSNKSSGKGGSEPPPTPPTPPTPPASSTPSGGSAALTSAVISVNGLKELVMVGGNFPASRPLFHLVSVSEHGAKISIAGGALASGDANVTLKEGVPLTLMNTSDGTRYKLQLYPQGTKVPTTPAPTGSTTTVPATTATPATTTTGK
jgi:hypothetical protein